MSANWTAFPFKRALATAVAARAGITGLTPTVKMLTYLPNRDEPLTDSIILGFSLRDDKEKVGLGGKTHDETVDIISQVRVLRPSGGQDVADAAEDRAEALLAEVDSELRVNALVVAGAQIINPGVVSRESILFSTRASDGTPGKVCIIEFTIRYLAKTSP